MQGRTVAVVSNGSALLGLGNVGPKAALPVMEGKAVLMKELAGIDAIPLVLDSSEPDRLVETIKDIAPGFAAINLEDIAAPECFYIEERLMDELDIPVMHDDQHGTAIVVLAALINAHRVVHKDLARSRIAIVGAGAAGTGITRLLLQYGVGDIVLIDRHGIVSTMRTDLTPTKQHLASLTNTEQRFGGTMEALAGSDVVIGVSRAGTVTSEHVRMMAQRPIVFALANPEPEIYPSDALSAGAAVVATGRSDFPNQVNNALVFPGMFKGALRNKVQRFTDTMKLDAALALANLVSRPTAKKILPSIFDKRIVRTVAQAVHR